MRGLEIKNEKDNDIILLQISKMTKNEFYKAFESYSSLLLIFILTTINI